MTRILAALLFLSLLGSASDARCQQPSTTALPFVLLEARSNKNSASYSANWMTDYGSYDVSFRTASSVDVSVRNSSREAQPLTLRCLFFGNQPGTTRRSIFATYQKDISLAQNESQRLEVQSPFTAGRDECYTLLGARFVRGVRYEGWLVQIFTRYEKRLVRQVASTSFLDDLAKTPALAAMEKQFTDYADSDLVSR